MSNAQQLAAILKKSKAIMQETEENFGRTGNETNNNTGGGMSSTPQTYDEKEIPNLTEQFINKNSGSPKSVAPVDGQYRNLSTTKLPKEIVEAMINNPIDIPESPFSVESFDVNEVSRLMQESPTREQITEQPREVKVPVKRKKNSTPKTTVSNDTIRKIVKEEMEDVVRGIISEYFDTSLVTEDIQIKVGGTVFSGNLKPLPKKTVKKKRRV